MKDKSAVSVERIVQVPPLKKAEVFYVVGTGGGVGASTFAAALAHCLSFKDNSRVALIDMDIGGGGLLVPLGIDSSTSNVWENVTRWYITNVEKLFEKLPKFRNISVLSFGYAKPEFVSLNKMCSIVDTFAEVCDFQVLDVPKSLIIQESLLSLGGTIIFITPRNASGVASAVALNRYIMSTHPEIDRICITCQPSQKSLAKLFTREQVKQYLSIPIVGELVLDKKTRLDLSLGQGPVLRKKSPLTNILHKTVEQIFPDNKGK